MGSFDLSFLTEPTIPSAAELPGRFFSASYMTSVAMLFLTIAYYY
jgi:hypothetical protein